MAQLNTIVRRDIHAQLATRDGQRKAGVQLSDWSHIVIDLEAVKGGKERTDKYLTEWHRPTRGYVPDPAGEADQAAAALENASPRKSFKSYIRTGGFTPVDE